MTIRFLQRKNKQIFPGTWGGRRKKAVREIGERGQFGLSTDLEGDETGNTEVKFVIRFSD